MALGQGNVEDEGGLVDQISSWQFSQWANYFEAEPFGANQQALQSALLIMLVNNAVSNEKIRRPSQVFPQLHDPPISDEVREKRWEMWAKAENKRAEMEEAEEEVVHLDGG